MFAYVAKLLGKQPLLRKYTSEADWQQTMSTKKDN